MDFFTLIEISAECCYVTEGLSPNNKVSGKYGPMFVTRKLCICMLGLQHLKVLKEPILSVRSEYTLNGMPVYCRVPCIHTHPILTAVFIRFYR